MPEKKTTDPERTSQENRNMRIALTYLSTPEVQKALIDSRDLNLPEDSRLSVKATKPLNPVPYVVVQVSGERDSKFKGYRPPGNYEVPELPNPDDFKGYRGKKKLREAREAWKVEDEARRMAVVQSAVKVTLQERYKGHTTCFLWDGTQDIATVLSVHQGVWATVRRYIEEWPYGNRNTYPELAPEKDLYKDENTTKSTEFLVLMPGVELTQGEADALRKHLVFIHKLGDKYAEYLKEALKNYDPPEV